MKWRITAAFALCLTARNEIFYGQRGWCGFRREFGPGARYLNEGRGLNQLYEFLADNGQEEVRADGGIFEPLTIRLTWRKPSSPSEAFQFRKTTIGEP